MTSDGTCRGGVRSGQRGSAADDAASDGREALATVSAPPGLRQRIGSGAVLITLANGVREVSGLVVFLVLARLLGPEAYGLVGMAMVVITLGQTLLQESVSEALVQVRDLRQDHLDSLFWVILGLAGTLTLTVLAGAGLLAEVYGQPEVAAYARWLALTMLLIGMSAVPAAQLKRELRFGSLALRSLVSVLVGGGVGITLALKGFGVWSLVGLHLSQRLTEAVALWAASAWRPKLRLSWEPLRELLAYALTMLGLRIANAVDKELPRFMIGVFLGATALGYFIVAWRVLEILMRLLIQPLATVTFPAFARVQTDLARVRRMLLSASPIAALIALPSFVGVALLSPEMVSQFLGPDWRAGTSPLIQALCALGAISSQIMLFNSLIRALGRPDLILFMSLAGITFNALALYLLSPLGTLAVAVAITLRSYVMLPLPLWAAHRLTSFDVRRLVRLHLPVLLCTLIMVAAVSGWHSLLPAQWPERVTLVTAIIVGLLAYGVALAYLARPLLRDLFGSVRLPQACHVLIGRILGAPPQPL